MDTVRFPDKFELVVQHVTDCLHQADDLFTQTGLTKGLRVKASSKCVGYYVLPEFANYTGREFADLVAEHQGPLGLFNMQLMRAQGYKSQTPDVEQFLETCDEVIGALEQSRQGQPAPKQGTVVLEEPRAPPSSSGARRKRPAAEAEAEAQEEDAGAGARPGPSGNKKKAKKEQQPALALLAAAAAGASSSGSNINIRALELQLQITQSRERTALVELLTARSGLCTALLEAAKGGHADLFDSVTDEALQALQAMATAPL